MSHAPAAPSSLATIVACLAHLQMAAPHKDGPPTPESMEGDAAHWVNAQWVTTNLMPAVGTLAPNGVPVDEDMQEGARVWRDIVGDYGNTEVTMAIPSLHPTQCWGTPDWWQYDPIAGRVRTWDYKYGHGFVDVFEFWQGIAYVIGVIDKLKLPPETSIEIGIYQPRNFHKDGPIRTWKLPNVAALMPYVERARRAIERSLIPHPPATVGPHCDHCEGRHECATLQQAAMNATAYTNQMDRVNLPAAAIGTELRILEAAAQLIEARMTGLQEQGMSLIKAGQRVPGYAIEHTQGHLKWDKPVGEVLALGELFGVDLRKPAEPITPTQAIKKKIDASVIQAYASRPSGKPKLAADSTVQTRKIFGANTQ